jgi:GntR family transcriptional regulator/MocR family aminotransferase
MGVPAAFARIRACAARVEASAAPIHPDPRGELELRREIAGYLAIARGIDCSPSQIIVTGGYGAGLGLAFRVLGLEGEKAWIEDPGFPFARKGLELALAWAESCIDRLCCCQRPIGSGVFQLSKSIRTG